MSTLMAVKAYAFNWATWIPLAAAMTAIATGIVTVYINYRTHRRDRLRAEREDEEAEIAEHVKFALSMLDRAEFKEKIVDIIVRDEKVHALMRDGARQFILEELPDSPVIIDLRDAIAASIASMQRIESIFVEAGARRLLNTSPGPVRPMDQIAVKKDNGSRS